MFVDELTIQDDYIFNKGINADFIEKFDCFWKYSFFQIT